MEGSRPLSVKNLVRIMNILLIILEKENLLHDLDEIFQKIIVKNRHEESILMLGLL